MYAQAGYGAVAWGFLYNTFAFADMAIALAVGVLMLLNTSFRKIVNKVTAAGVLSEPVSEPVASAPTMEEGETEQPTQEEEKDKSIK